MQKAADLADISVFQIYLFFRYIWAVFFTAGAIKYLAINWNTDPKEYVLSVLWESTKYSRNPFRVCEGFFLKYRFISSVHSQPKIR